MKNAKVCLNTLGRSSMFNKKTLWLASVSVVLMVLSTGCGDSDSEPSSEAPTLSSIWDEGTLESCALCHSPQGQEADGPDFSTPALFVSTLVGKKQADYPDWYLTSDCSETIPFITAGDAQNSTILSAVVEEDSQRMQNENNCASSYNVHEANQVVIAKDSELYNDLVAWIDAGAINN